LFLLAHNALAWSRAIALREFITRATIGQREHGKQRFSFRGYMKGIPANRQNARDSPVRYQPTARGFGRHRRKIRHQRHPLLQPPLASRRLPRLRRLA
jgi:hypothetical protein